MINNAQLNIRDLSLQRGDRLLLEKLDISVSSGEAIEIRGPNGSGKTTLLRAIAGLHSPKSGTINISGGVDLEHSEYIGLLSHLDAIKPNETIEHQLHFWCELFCVSKVKLTTVVQKLKIKHLLGLLGGSLSAGQKRRVAIARIMLSERPIWLLDEPAAPLDDDGRKILGSILQEHLNNGGIIIAAVHDALPIKHSRVLQIDDIGGSK